MSKQFDLINDVEQKLSGAKGIVDVCRIATADGCRAAHGNGASDESISWALYTAQDMIDSAQKNFREVVALAKAAGPRAA